MKKSIVIMFFLVFVILCISPKVNMYTVKADYIEKDNESYQYEFVCKITDIIETKQFKGEGTNIPYTYYSARIIDKIKGELETNIVIKFYGGYDESNNLILMENMNYLEYVKTIMHELGHVLCLDEFTNIESRVNVMHQGIRQYVQFGLADLAAYYYLWRH